MRSSALQYDNMPHIVGGKDYYKASTGTPVSTVTFRTDGTIQNNAATPVNEWLNIPDTSTASQYEIRVTNTGGAVPTGSALATWLAMTTQRAWSVTGPGSLGVNTANVTIDLRLASTGAVVVTVNNTITAEKV